HAAMLARLSDENAVEVDAVPLDDRQWRVTVAGFDRVGDLSLICGLLFVHGFNITDGNVFTAEHGSATHRGGRSAAGEKPASGMEAPKFVDVFTVRPPRGKEAAPLWDAYRSDLAELMRLSDQRSPREAQGALARRVAEAVRGHAARPLG